MGWLDYHLHLFRIRRKHAHSITLIGIPDEDRFEDDPEITAGWEVSISDFFYDVGTTFDYEYDFGDSWEHEIIHEGILLKEKGVKYPVCIGGARACPPEDCGKLSLTTNRQNRLASSYFKLRRTIRRWRLTLCSEIKEKEQGRFPSPPPLS